MKKSYASFVVQGTRRNDKLKKQQQPMKRTRTYLTHKIFWIPLDKFFVNVENIKEEIWMLKK
jgi:hypothetical protein